MTSAFIPNSFQHPNAYIDLYAAFLTGEEAKVLTYTIRRIIGFHKRQDRISLSQYTDGIHTEEGKALDYGTGLSKGAVRKALAELIKYGLMVEVSPAEPKKNLPPAYALEWESEKVNFEGLRARAEAKKRANTKRTKKARKTAREAPPSVGQTGYTPVCATDEPPSVGQTSPRLSDNTTKDQLERSEEIPDIHTQGIEMFHDIFIDPNKKQQNPGALEALRRNEARAAAGELDLAQWSEDTWPHVRAFAQTFGIVFLPKDKSTIKNWETHLRRFVRNCAEIEPVRVMLKIQEYSKDWTDGAGVSRPHALHNSTTRAVNELAAEQAPETQEDEAHVEHVRSVITRARAQS